MINKHFFKHLFSNNLKQTIMKKMIFSFIVVLAITITLISWKTAKTTAGGAIHIDDFGCGMLNGNGGFLITTDSKQVITPSGNDNFKCQADNVPNASGSSVKWNFANTGLICGTALGGTTDWQEIVSGSGQATLQCKVH